MTSTGLRPQTAAGRKLLASYREAVMRRPTLDGLLTVFDIRSIENEAAFRILDGVMSSAGLRDSEQAEMMEILRELQEREWVISPTPAP